MSELSKRLEPGSTRTKMVVIVVLILAVLIAAVVIAGLVSEGTGRGVKAGGPVRESEP